MKTPTKKTSTMKTLTKRKSRLLENVRLECEFESSILLLLRDMFMIFDNCFCW
jgi:hypothetical protein